MAVALDNLHAWLRGSCPASASELMAELQLGHRAVPEAYVGLPRDAVELTEALRALEIRGLVAKDGGEWRWRAEAVKVDDPQRSLFV